MLKRNYFYPHWCPKCGLCMCSQRAREELRANGACRFCLAPAKNKHRNTLERARKLKFKINPRALNKHQESVAANLSEIEALTREHGAATKLLWREIMSEYKAASADRQWVRTLAIMRRIGVPYKRTIQEDRSAAIAVSVSQQEIEDFARKSCKKHRAEWGKSCVRPKSTSDDTL